MEPDKSEGNTELQTCGLHFHPKALMCGRDLLGRLVQDNTVSAKPVSRSPCGCCVLQVVSTGMLLCFLSSILDTRNNSVPRSAIAPLAGSCIVCLGVAFGYNTGFPINPARDFSPRLFLTIAGWGTDVWSAGHHWWWVPIVAPPLGAVAGAFVYKGAVEAWHPPHDKPS